MKSEIEKALEYAYRLLDIRGRSSSEMTERLLRKGFSQNTAAQVLEKLKGLGLMDDVAFARGWVSARLRAGEGAFRIKRGLLEKGIDEELIEEVLKPLPAGEEEAVRAREVLSRRAVRYRRLDRETAFRRASAFLVRRGFSYPAALEAVRICLRETGEKQ